MTRRAGTTAGRDAGSSTGVATAALALLSAGTLAALGMVTAGEIRDLGVGPRPPAARVDQLGADFVAIQPQPPTGGDRGGPRAGGRRAGRGGGSDLDRAGPADATTGGPSRRRPGLAGSGSAPAPSPASSPSPVPVTPTPPPVVPTPVVPDTSGPQQPVFTGVTPSPPTRVLGEKRGRRVGQRPAARHRRIRWPHQVSPGRAEGRAGPRPAAGLAVTVAAGSALAAVTSAADDAERSPGRRGHGPAGLPTTVPAGPAPSGHGKGPSPVLPHRDPVAAPPVAAPTVPGAAPPAARTVPGRGREHGHR